MSLQQIVETLFYSSKKIIGVIPRRETCSMTRIPVSDK